MSIPAKFHACITKCTILLKNWIYLLGYDVGTGLSPNPHFILSKAVLLTWFSVLLVLTTVSVMISSSMCLDDFCKV